MIAMSMPTNGTGAFVGGADGGSTYADFDQAFDAVNASNSGNGTARYPVRSGDTLQSIAATLFGDASLWYIIGEANGLTSSSALSAGQSLTIPGKIANFHNNADTFRPYDASKAIGDTAPTTPRPPKKAAGCGIIGAILLVAVAVAVTIATQGTAAAFASSLGVGAASSTGAAIAGGALAAAAGSIASQAVGLATGLQSKFSFKGVALAALAGGIGGGLGKLIPAGAVAGSKLVTDVVRGVAGSVLTQGVATVTGLQSKFSFTGVAVAGVAAGVGGAIRGSRTDFATRTLAGAASAIAGAGARSLATGSSFGDNIRAVLPDIIGQTVGGLIAEGIAGAGARGRTAKPDAKLAQNGSGVTIADPGPLNIPIDLASIDASLKDTLAAARVAFGGAVTAAQTSALVNATSAGGASGGRASANGRQGTTGILSRAELDLLGLETRGQTGGIRTSDRPTTTLAALITADAEAGNNVQLALRLAGYSGLSGSSDNPFGLADTFLNELPISNDVDPVTVGKNINSLRQLIEIANPFVRDPVIGEAVGRNLGKITAAINVRAPNGIFDPAVQEDAITTNLATFGLGTLASGGRAAATAAIGRIEARSVAEGATDAIRSRVLENIAESRLARESSNFGIYIARTDQLSYGYAADKFSLTSLSTGQRVFGGLPGQSAYYTDSATLAASGGSRASLFESLQVRPHPEFGFRPAVGEYEVIRDIRVPFGSVQANSNYGIGGGNQYFIGDYNKSLRLIQEIPLGK